MHPIRARESWDDARMHRRPPVADVEREQPNAATRPVAGAARGSDASLLLLQRTAGNRAVGASLARRTAVPRGSSAQAGIAARSPSGAAAGAPRRLVSRGCAGTRVLARSPSVLEELYASQAELFQAIDNAPRGSATEEELLAELRDLNDEITEEVARSALSAGLDKRAAEAESEGEPARQDGAQEAFLAVVAKIAAEEERPATDDELELLEGILDRIAGEDRRRLEKEILLWPKNFRALNDIVELVTGARNPLAADIMDRIDAAAARFDEAVGEKLKNELVKAAKGYTKGANNCLNFLMASGVHRLSSGSPAEVKAAKDRYEKGYKERLATTPRHAKTLSRLAAELRILGLVGSARLLRWSGGRYRPSATAHFERLTGAGDGWYFFLVSVGSFHTFVIAVRVTGENRRYVKIQDGGAVRKYDAELNEYFDEYGALGKCAAARFWPVYAAPAPFAPAAGSGVEEDEPVILEDDEPVILE
jgi:hypothetical protein